MNQNKNVDVAGVKQVNSKTAKRVLIRTLSVAIALGLGACAKHRPIEEVKDPDNKKQQKALLTGKTWFGKVTVVKTSNNSGPFIVGLQSRAKLGHFEFTEKKLKYISDEGLYKENTPTMTGTLVNAWDVTHHDVKLAEVNDKPTNREEEDPDKKWHEKREFKINFETAVVNESEEFWTNLSCMKRDAAELVEGSLQITDSYLTWVVEVNYNLDPRCIIDDQKRRANEDLTHTVQFRYSYMTVQDRDYTPYQYKGEFDPAMKKFGYFETRREQLDSKDGRPKTVVLMDRWDPNKTHHYYFTKGFPQEYKWMFNDPQVGIFPQTNKLLEKNGIKARFYVHENDGKDGQAKELGDIRYSFVNFMSERASGAPLGYGPHDALPHTGEIVAGNIHIWTSALSYYVNDFLPKQDARFQKRFEESTLFDNMNKTLANIGLPEATKPSDWTTPFTYGAREGEEQIQNTGTHFKELIMERTFAYEPWSPQTQGKNTPDSLIKFRNVDQIVDRLGNSEITDLVKSHHQHAVDHAHSMHKENERLHMMNVYPLEPVLATARRNTIFGWSKKEVLDSILYNTSIHEFGHNLALRHNFYGSVDKPNFAAGRDQKVDGKVVKTQGYTSSVMDYLDLKEEISQVRDWAPYDKAAIAYNLSGGRIKPKKDFLFCTDQHKIYNAMCNLWDSGTSPSEVMMNLIETYEDRYWVRNFRNDRSYWDTSGYAGAIFSTMWDAKRFVGLSSALNSNEINKYLDEKNIYDENDRTQIRREISDSIIRANQLAIAFYNAVVQQKASERNYRTEYDNFTGEVKKIGIGADKFYATMFLMGDDEFTYDTSSRFNASYLKWLQNADFQKLLDDVLKTNLTVRPAMDPGFIGFGRVLFALSATSWDNYDDPTLIQKIKVKRYTLKELTENFPGKTTTRVVTRAVEPPEGQAGPPEEVVQTEVKVEVASNVVQAAMDDLGTHTFRIDSETKDSFFKLGDEVGLVEYNDMYYMVDRARSPYSYEIVKNIMQNREYSSTVQGKDDLMTLYHFYIDAIRDRR